MNGEAGMQTTTDCRCVAQITNGALPCRIVLESLPHRLAVSYSVKHHLRPLGEGSGDGLGENCRAFLAGTSQEPCLTRNDFVHESCELSLKLRGLFTTLDTGVIAFEADQVDNSVADDLSV